MSGDAKRFRALHGSAGRHGEAFWQEEKDNVGLRLLKGMGWSSGQGLGKNGQGSVEHVKQRRRKDNAGIGATANTRDEAFKASQELFNDVLARLSGGGDAGAADANKGPAALGSAATSIKGVVARGQMARRFVRSGKVASYSSSVSAESQAGKMNEILGRKKRNSKEAADGEGNGGEGYVPDLHENQSTSTVSVGDYFAKRRKELGLPGASDTNGNKRSGFTLDDQAHFAESQMAASYGGGRRGLGAFGNDGDDEEEDTRKWQPKKAVTAAAAVVPPPPAPAAAAAAASSSSSSSFNWKKAIKEALRAAPGGELRLKLLRKAVLKQHKQQEGKADKEEARRVFKKRLKKTSGVVLSGKMVKLG